MNGQINFHINVKTPCAGKAAAVGRALQQLLKQTETNMAHTTLQHNERKSGLNTFTTVETGHFIVQARFPAPFCHANEEDL